MNKFEDTFIKPNELHITREPFKLPEGELDRIVNGFVEDMKRAEKANAELTWHKRWHIFKGHPVGKIFKTETPLYAPVCSCGMYVNYTMYMHGKWRYRWPLKWVLHPIGQYKYWKSWKETK